MGESLALNGNIVNGGHHFARCTGPVDVNVPAGPAVPAYEVTTMFDRAPDNWGVEGWQSQPRLNLPTT